MKKALFLILGVLCLCAVEASAEAIFEIEVTFEYTVATAPQPVTGYKLYKEGSPVTTWDGAYVFTRNVIVELPETTSTNFTLTAMYIDGTESLHSPQYPFNPAEGSRPATPTNFRRISSIFGKLIDKDEVVIRQGTLLCSNPT